MFPTLPALPLKLQSKVNGEIKPGESIFWAGQPNPNRRMLAGFGLWLFFIPWTAFALFWMAMAGGLALIKGEGGAFDFFPLFGLPFILVGIGGLLSPFWMRMGAKRTVYVITNQRVFTISGVFSTKYKSFHPEQIQFIEREEKSSGSGNLIFSRNTYRDSQGSSRTKEDGFYAVQNVKAVERHLENLLRNKNPVFRDTNNLLQ